MKTAILKVQSVGGVAEYRLANGLRVLYRHETASPTVAVCVTFHVGSRNEAIGHTGSTHILEHLLFKDSKGFNRANGKAITDYLEWFGALLNATTWLDRTNYFELMPKERLPEALALEADRLRNSLFTDTDLASEMTVVRNEFERSRNDPFELLDEAVMAKAFTKHPYRIPTIGTKKDIEASTAKKLREFYNTYYWPNNATLMVVGDVPWSIVKQFVLAYFGPIPMSPKKIPTLKVVEPHQSRARSVVLKKPLGVSIASLTYKAPKGTHKDYPALLAAVSALANGFGSRLRKALVDTGLAADLSASAHAQHDPGVVTFTAHVADGISPKAALKEMRKVVKTFAQQGPSRSELDRVKERLLSELSAERDGVLNEARSVSEALAAGDWTLAYTMEDSLASLTPAAVARAARTYLLTSGETSGILQNA